MNAPSVAQRGAIASLTVNRDMTAVRQALKSSLYPDASDESVDMVLAYCNARGLDPMTKPVHIVPMWIPEKKEGDRVRRGYMRDVIMPGIGAYRIDAHRTGEYAGQDEPVFGPTIEKKFSDGDKPITLSFPEWCKVTVYRMLGDTRVAYSAKVFWLETYATASRYTNAPNTMWRRRPFGQLEKCAEALALRKAFPEAVGSEPTAEEMEGATTFIEGEVTSRAADTGVIRMPEARKPAAALSDHSVSAGPIETTLKRDAAPAEPVATAAEQEQSAAGQTQADGWDVGDSQRRMVMVLAKQAGLTGEDEVLAKFRSINTSNLNAVLADLRRMKEERA